MKCVESAVNGFASDACRSWRNVKCSLVKAEHLGFYRYYNWMVVGIPEIQVQCQTVFQTEPFQGQSRLD